jgi:hypothetical protein
VSATPEQIAVELEDLANQLRAGTDNGWDYIDDLRAAAALIRAQAERVRVLEEALGAIAALPRYTDGDNEAQDIARAALKAAP